MGGAPGRLASKRQRCCSPGAARDRESRQKSLGHLAVASRDLNRVPVDALPASPRPIWALTRAAHMYRMCAALLSYTEEGRDWAPRCPPIATGALSFYRTEATRPRSVRTGLRRALCAASTPLRLVACASVGSCVTRGLILFGSASRANPCQRGGLTKRPTRRASEVRNHCAHPRRAPGTRQQGRSAPLPSDPACTRARSGCTNGQR
jgi:hypothetical protein